MAEISFEVNRRRLVAASDNPHFLLTDGTGGYLALGAPNISNYDGYFIRTPSGNMKVLAGIFPVSAVSSQGGISSLLSDGSSIALNDAAKSSIYLLEEGILAEFDGEFIVSLDCKRLYDESEDGRMYSVDIRSPTSDRPGTLSSIAIATISYTKYEDGSLTNPLYSVHVCVATTMNALREASWRKATYPYDDMRGTHSTPWVFDALRLTGAGSAAIAAGDSVSSAQRKAMKMLLEKEQRIQNHRRDNEALPSLPSLPLLAWRSLRSLLLRRDGHVTGIMAGLPWFFHEWSRDELISCGGLLAAKQYDAVIAVLNKWYDIIRPDGTLPAIYPDQGIASSDAPGWLGKRTHDLLLKLSAENLMHRVPPALIARWRDQTGALLDRCATRINDGLLWSDKNTTWMDTSDNDDGREGACIEIQALFLALYDAHAYLCTMTKTPVDTIRSERARAMVAAVHSRFVTSGLLLDGLHRDGSQDYAIRPNLFLAWYVAPRMFSDDEWRGFFAAVLPKLWLSWGGLASLQTDHPNFHSRYTGEHVASYHRGDSWYFVNNIAAIAMNGVGKSQFDAQVRAILRASVRDMLSLGYVGHCSEISSAERQEAAGCFAQAWSASTLLEALLAMPETNL